jgi:predicted peptidase
MKATIFLLIVLSAALPVRADDKPSAFETHTFTWHGGAKLPYRLLKPHQIEPGKKYPLVLILHGWGEHGTDNQKQLKDFGEVFLKADVRKRFPCFVLLPQADGSWVQRAVFDNPIRLTKTPAASLALTNELLKTLLKHDPVDADRLYLTGYSNGACGVWELLEREPQVWAAAAPLAGAGDPGRIVGAKHVPIWVFHGAKDKTIPIERMTEMVAALHSAHGHPMFSIIPNGAHYDAKNSALHDPNFLPWMFAQHRGSAEVPFEKIAKPKDKRPTSLAKAQSTAK